MSGIRLGLGRIAKLLEKIPQPWKAVHVAGTNGKGSVCNYTYGMLQAAGVNCGMFTSPHLIDRWDCISLNGQPIAKDHFESIEERVKARDKRLQTDASPFELLTATAFEAFTEAKVEIAVVETGLGGIEDATNIIQRPAVSVITKLGLDHEDLLGKGIENIVKHKVGIVKYRSPCLIDGTNSSDVILMLHRKATLLGAKPLEICDYYKYSRRPRFSLITDWLSMPDHKRMHIILAFEASRFALKAAKKGQPDWKEVMPLLADMTFPGRQQSISIRALTGRLPHVLLDGCHNEQSAEALGSMVATKYRSLPDDKGRICWVLAGSSGKDIEGILSHLVKSTDDVIATEFGPVDGMPWISPVSAEYIARTAREFSPQSCTTATTISEALHKATELAGTRPIVIAGSLYLVSDVLRLLRDANHQALQSEPETENI